MKKEKKVKPRSRFRYIVHEVFMTALILVALNVTLVQAYHIPTGSMESTVMIGDRILADKFTVGIRTPDWIGVPFTQIGTPVPFVKLPGLRHVEPGDVVLVRTPADPKTPYLKRAIATGGQVIEIMDKQLFVDGNLFTDEQLAEHRDENLYPDGMPQKGIPRFLGNRDNFGPYTVPDGKVFCMGDNRDNSFDSRFMGPFPEEDILGIARMVYWSWDGGSDTPLWKRLRYRQFGRWL